MSPTPANELLSFRVLTPPQVAEIVTLAVRQVDAERSATELGQLDVLTPEQFVERFPTFSLRNVYELLRSGKWPGYQGGPGGKWYLVMSALHRHLFEEAFRRQGLPVPGEESAPQPLRRAR